MCLGYSRALDPNQAFSHTLSLLILYGKSMASLRVYSLCKDSDYFAQNEEKGRNIWKLQINFLSLQCERRNQVEPRCAERWHLRDDEQFDLAAWFLFTLEKELVTCGQLLLYLDIAFAVKLLLVGSIMSRDR